MRLAWIANAVWDRRAVTVPTGALLYLLLLVVATHLPPTGMRPIAHAFRFHFTDKFGHAGAYGGLTLLALAVWRIHRPSHIELRQKLSALLGICTLIACWGLVDEVTQPMFGRQFDWFDWLANLLGMALAVCASASIPRHVRHRWLEPFSMR